LVGEFFPDGQKGVAIATADPGAERTHLGFEIVAQQTGFGTAAAASAPLPESAADHTDDRLVG
jgi:hypothetical protein